MLKIINLAHSSLYWLLQASWILYLSFFFNLLFLFVYNVVLLLFSVLLIKILLLRPNESIKTSYSYYNHDDSRKPPN